MAATIKQIAEAANVSIPTVSRILSGKGDVHSEKTRQRITEISKKLGYKPNYLGKALAGGKTMTIGLVTGLGNPTSIGYTRSIIRAAEKQNYLTHTLDVYQRGDDSEYLIRRVKDLLDRKVDGLVIYRSHPITDQTLQFLKTSHVPIVFVGAGLPEHWNSGILLDRESAIDNLAQHLYELGHKRVAYFPSGESYDYLDHKIRPYQRAFLKRSMDFVTDRRWLINSQAKDLADDTYRVVVNCLKEDKAITALLMNNDIGAMGAFSAARAMNLKVPDCLSIAGFDDITGAKHLHTPLTTIRPPDPDQIGAATFNMLDTLMENPDAKIEKQTFNFKLITRQSTGRVSPTYQKSERAATVRERITLSGSAAPTPTIKGAAHPDASGQQRSKRTSDFNSASPPQTSPNFTKLGRGFHCQTNNQSFLRRQESS